MTNQVPSDICRILLVDDDGAVSAPVARYFRSKGCHVDVAAELEEAQALVTHRRYDLAIVDLRLTKVGNADGLEVLRDIRKRDHWTCLIVLTAYAGVEIEEEATRLGADALLRKPQPLDGIAALAFRLMGRAA